MTFFRKRAVFSPARFFLRRFSRVFRIVIALLWKVEPAWSVGLAVGYQVSVSQVSRIQREDTAIDGSPLVDTATGRPVGQFFQMRTDVQQFTASSTPQTLAAPYFCSGLHVVFAE